MTTATTTTTPASYPYSGMPGADARARADYVQSLGVDPHSDDDTQFGVTWVYCGSHLAVHNTGWCTVRNAMKTPLDVTSIEEGNAKCREYGFRLYRDRDKD